MRMRSLILYVVSCYGVYKCVCFCTMMSWCSVKASASIQNSPRSPRNVTGPTRELRTISSGSPGQIFSRQVLGWTAQ